jgi:para-nitrobenzyl esterase
MQEQWIAFARNGAPADDAVWRPYSEDERIVVIGDDLYQGRIEDDPVVPLLHRLRAVESASPRGLLGLIRRLLPI